jgi:arginine-tRNA-protein transferase
METVVHETEYGPCPYLEGRVWRVEEFDAPVFDPNIYEALLAEGWRRSGSIFYRARCRDCALCIPLRLDIESFEPSKSQRRLERINADIAGTLRAADFSTERYELYRRYSSVVHHAEEVPEPLARASYASFLLGGPLGSTGIIEYRDGKGALVATGYVDLLPGGLSSVYFAYDPAESRRSLGTWSVLRELALARRLGKRYYYLGFWVPGSPKMDYKANFHPFQYARDGAWRPSADRREALTAMGLP